jgi:hypothetical protein
MFGCARAVYPLNGRAWAPRRLLSQLPNAGAFATPASLARKFAPRKTRRRRRASLAHAAARRAVTAINHNQP